MRLKITIFAAIALAILCYSPIVHFSTQETIPAVVITEKERINNEGESRFMVWTEAETFENTDSLWALKFDSADTYGKMRVGATCDLRVVGFRVPFLSMNRNILQATCS